MKIDVIQCYNESIQVNPMMKNEAIQTIVDQFKASRKVFMIRFKIT